MVRSCGVSVVDGHGQLLAGLVSGLASGLAVHSRVGHGREVAGKILRWPVT